MMEDEICFQRRQSRLIQESIIWLRIITFFFFFFFKATGAAYGSSQAGVELFMPQQRQIQATSTTYTLYHCLQLCHIYNPLSRGRVETASS